MVKLIMHASYRGKIMSAFSASVNYLSANPELILTNTITAEYITLDQMFKPKVHQYKVGLYRVNQFINWDGQKYATGWQQVCREIQSK